MPRDDFDYFVKRELNLALAKRKVQELLAMEDAPEIREKLSMFMPTLTAREFKAQDGDPVLWRIDGLAQVGDNVTLTAAAKSGKTTLFLNLMRSLCDGVPFLNQGVVPPDGNILYSQLELDERRSREWLQAIDIKHDDKLFIHNLRGKPVPLWDDYVVEFVIGFLKTHEIETWIIDPRSQLVAGWPGSPNPENDNGVQGTLNKILDKIKEEAGVNDLYIAVHTGHTGTHARGGSIQLGWHDVNWLYVVRSMAGADDMRFFSAYGRDVDFTEHAVELLDGKRLKLIADTSALKVRSMAKAVVHALKGQAAGLNARALKSAIKNVDNNHKQDAVNEAMRLGWILQDKGPKGAVITKLNERNPEVQEMIIEHPGEGWES